MKRTKQRFDKDEQTTPMYVSGCRTFEGEDRSILLSFFVINVWIGHADRMQENAER